MASDGSHGPRPFAQRHASTIFLRVPTGDWIAVTRGTKTEFRASPRSVTQANKIEVPTPVVAYRVRHEGAHETQRTHDSRLMVLEDSWQEPLGAITEESLEREGFPNVAHFRRYWMQRERRRFAPTRMICAFRVRPWQEGMDERRFADRLFERLYGDFTPG